MKKVMITGAMGFIGSWVVKEMRRQGVDVIAVIRENASIEENHFGGGVRIICCDMKNYEMLPSLVEDRDIDVIFHFAWDGVSGERTKSSSIQTANLRATLDLIKASSEMKCGTFIGSGSLHEIESFYEMQENKPIDNLGYMYKASKLAAHWMGKALAGSLNIRFFWPVVANAYGEEETSQRLVNTVIRSVLKGESPKLSAGKQNYDFLHIADVAHAFYLIAEKGINGTNYIIGSGEAKPLREYLEVVGKIANDPMGTAIPLGFGEITSNVVYLPKSVFSISQLVEDTGFSPTITFEEGIKRTVNWIVGQG